MYSLASLFSGIYQFPAMHSLLVTIISPTNGPTPPMQDYHHSLTPSQALQLCSFPRLTAAHFLWNGRMLINILRWENAQVHLNVIKLNRKILKIRAFNGEEA